MPDNLNGVTPRARRAAIAITETFPSTWLLRGAEWGPLIEKIGAIVQEALDDRQP